MLALSLSLSLSLSRHRPRMADEHTPYYRALPWVSTSQGKLVALTELDYVYRTDSALVYELGDLPLPIRLVSQWDKMY